MNALCCIRTDLGHYIVVGENNEITGGLIILFAEEFLQTLPIVTRGTPADELKASLKASYLWLSVNCIGLKTNMRVHIHGDESAADFARHVLAIGNEAVPRDGLITISPNVSVVHNYYRRCKRRRCMKFTHPD